MEILINTGSCMPDFDEFADLISNHGNKKKAKQTVTAEQPADDDEGEGGMFGMFDEAAAELLTDPQEVIYGQKVMEMVQTRFMSVLRESFPFDMALDIRRLIVCYISFGEFLAQEL
jgi:hypothetical protein